MTTIDMRPFRRRRTSCRRLRVRSRTTVRFVGNSGDYWRLLMRGAVAADAHARHLSVLARHRHPPLSCGRTPRCTGESLEYTGTPSSC